MGSFSEKGGKEGQTGSGGGGASLSRSSPILCTLPPPPRIFRESLTSIGHHQLRKDALLRERTSGKWIKVLLLTARSLVESGVPGICAGLEPSL